ncbi:MAG TPA: dual specificity protein phosphatase [Herpetosiphonaceae bacterium]
MPKHARLWPVPEAGSLLAAQLDDIREERRGRRLDLALDYQALELDRAPQLAVAGGRLAELAQGRYAPRRLRFQGVRWHQLRGLYADLAALPPDHPARSLRGMLHWSPPGAESRFLLINGSVEPARLMLSARECRAEERPGPETPAALVREWSPAPAFPARLVPAPARMLGRYNGDPIRLLLGGRAARTRLLIGSLEDQSASRPHVDLVVNLGEEPNPWMIDGQPVGADRWICQGEGPEGMDLATMIREADWLAAQLRAGRRVLVHCVAGMNRSATLCCAALMLLEGLGAEAALARVRESHPWARPDSHHWLKLRWLERLLGCYALAELAAADGERLLRLAAACADQPPA